MQKSRDLHNNFKFFISNSCLGTTCTTVNSWPNKPCVFPFKHLGKTYYECKENPGNIFWCRTGPGSHEWGRCGDTCRNHSSGIIKQLYRVNHQCCPGGNRPETPWRPPVEGLWIFLLNHWQIQTKFSKKNFFFCIFLKILSGFASDFSQNIRRPPETLRGGSPDNFRRDNIACPHGMMMRQNGSLIGSRIYFQFRLQFLAL